LILILKTILDYLMFGDLPHDINDNPALSPKAPSKRRVYVDDILI
jgi:hypothetical protein